MTTRTKLILALEVVVAVAIVGAAIFLVVTGPEDAPVPVPEPEPEGVAEISLPAPWGEVSAIGVSVEGRTIRAHSFGTGNRELLLVGGIHGGYEWNSVLLAYEMIDYLEANEEFVPAELKITVIPVLNPDGLAQVVATEGRFMAAEVTNWSTDGRGRFNARGVDLNRNFACNWSPESTWRGAPVETGSAAFSEPEAVALRDYVLLHQPRAVVFWHSVANAVYASECNDGILPDTLAYMERYAAAGQYLAVPVFDAYPITGDAEGWLASIGIPAITVELETRNTIEWERNLAGVSAVRDYLTSLP